ncbi:TPA: acyltransferase [Escherichia coli]|nr:acyltransferase [Escherichia coli]
MRFHALDIAKFVACLFIISLHVGTYPELGREFSDVINISGRWAVPFFFLLSGYFYGKSDKNVAYKLSKLIGVFLIACAVYFFVLISQLDYNFEAVIKTALSIKFFMSGTYFHLWFLCAIIYGYLGVAYFNEKKSGVLPLALALSLLLCCWFFDMLRSRGLAFEAFYVFRTLTAFSMLWAGMLIARHNKVLSFKVSLFICAISYALMLAEPLFLKYFMGFNVNERQFPLFAPVMSYGILMLCLSINVNESFFSRLGRELSLGVYIIHPVWIYVIYEMFKRMDINNSSMMFFSVATATILTLIALKRYAKYFFKKLNGY